MNILNSLNLEFQWAHKILYTTWLAYILYILNFEAKLTDIIHIIPLMKSLIIDYVHSEGKN